jgi:hypothetical protein
MEFMLPILTCSSPDLACATTPTTIYGASARQKRKLLWHAGFFFFSFSSKICVLGNLPFADIKSDPVRVTVTAPVSLPVRFNQVVPVESYSTVLLQLSKCEVTRMTLLPTLFSDDGDVNLGSTWVQGRSRMSCLSLYYSHSRLTHKG